MPGIEDPGLPEVQYESAIKNLKTFASEQDAYCIELNRRKVDEGIAGHCLIRRRLSEQDFIEIR